MEMMSFTITVIFSLIFTNIKEARGGSKPFVLVQSEDPTTGKISYGFPTCAVQDKDTGAVVYSAPGHSKVYYLCYPKTVEECGMIEGKQYTNQFCIFDSAPKTPKCQGDVTPVMRNVRDNKGNPMSCSKKKEGVENKLYRVGYNLEIIKGEEPIELDIYKFCFNEEIEKTIYVEYRIMSPKLLENKLVNDVHYVKDIDTSSYDAVEFGKFTKKLEFYKEKKKEDPSFEETLMIPSADMAMEAWKQPLFHIANVELLRKELREVIVYVDDYIRASAEQILGEIVIRTGVFDLENDLYEAWWKVIYDEDEKYAIALFIHNGDSSPTDDMLMCDQKEHSCEKYGWIGIVPNNMKNFIYCCPPQDIIKLFNLPNARTFDLGFLKKKGYFRKRKDCQNSDEGELNNRAKKRIRT